ncbi:MAG: hypothetical protein JWQ66_573 [Mucilaginibacter sp.]|nr:hypothetical protein [Mucilaginibacter sp.]
MKFLLARFSILFFVLASCMLLLASNMQIDRLLLQTKNAPEGILNIQNSFSVNTDTVIRAEWAHNKQVLYIDTLAQKPTTGLDFAKDQTYKDFYFIILYVLTLALLVLRITPEGIIDAFRKLMKIIRSERKISPVISRPENQFILWRIFLIACIVLSGIMNWLADCQELKLFNYHPFGVGLIFYPSQIKWFVLFAIASYLVLCMLFNALLVRLSDVLLIAARLFVRFRIVVIGLLVILFLLWAVDQGRDLLLVINDAPAGPVVLILSVFILALINWYLPKVYDGTQQNPKDPKAILKKGFNFLNDPDSSIQAETKRKVSRIFGVTTFLLPAACILHAMISFHIDYWLLKYDPFVILVVCTWGYILASKGNNLKSLFYGNGKLRPAFWMVMVLVIVAIIYGAIISNNGFNPFSLAVLALDLFMLSFVFFIITTLRAELVQISRIGKWSVQYFVFVPGVFAFFLFLCCNFWPIKVAFGTNLRYLTLPIIFTAVIFYTLFFSFLLVVGRKLKVQIITFIYLVGMSFAVFKISDFHLARLEPVKPKRNYPTLKQYAADWLKRRRGDMQQYQSVYPKGNYPVYLVNAYGGGIRASAWAAMAISDLDQKLKVFDAATHVKLNSDFQHYIFSYSGASGGTLGESVLCASRYSYISGKTKSRLETNCLPFFENDFLTPVIVGLLGSDVWGAFTGADSWDDRAALQERTWEEHSATFGFNYDEQLGIYWKDGKGEVPLLFSNTFDVDSGRKAIAAPLRLQAAEFPGAVMVDKLIADTDEMRLSTAAMLSARFPFVSPTGKIGDQHFADGGNIENSGAETSLEVEQVFKKVLDSLAKTDPIYLRVRIHFLSLPNSIPGLTAPSAKNLFELTAPLTGVFNLIDGNAGKADGINKLLSQSSGDFIYHKIQPTRQLQPIHGVWPVYPLGWQISSEALTSMRLSLAKDTNVNNVLGSIRPGYHP